MNETAEGLAEGTTKTHTEGNPDIEQLEQQALGKHYQQAEVLHKFVDEHPWFHPTLFFVGALIVAAVVWYFWRAKKAKKFQKDVS